MNDFLECITDNRPYLLGRHCQSGRTVLYRPDCKLWTCPHCANVKAKQWAARARHALIEYPEYDWHFLTLTIKESTGKLDRQIKIWRASWDKFSKRLRRAAREGVMYLIIPELSPEKKRLHAHWFFNWDFNCVPQPERYYSKWLHDHTAASGLGYEYDIQPVYSPEQASHYTTKYIGKGLSQTFPPGFRRVRTSQSFPECLQQQETSEYRWQVIPYSASGRTRLLLTYLRGELIWDIESQKPVSLRHELIQAF